MKKYLPHTLLIIYLILFSFLAINPYERSTWFVENLPVVITVIGLVSTYKKFKFSPMSYLLMFLFLSYHTIGGHYTFERVPFDFFNNIIGDGRNHFDRVGHFLVGVLPILLLSLLIEKNG